MCSFPALICIVVVLGGRWEGVEVGGEGREVGEVGEGGERGYGG